MTAPGVPQGFTFTNPDSAPANDSWSNPSIPWQNQNPERLLFFWQPAQTNSGSGRGSLAGAQFQIATNREMTQNSTTITTPTISGNSFFQFGGVFSSGTFGSRATDTVYFGRMRVRNGNFNSGTEFVPKWNENTSIGLYGPWTSVVALKVGQIPPRPPTTFTVNSFFGGSALAAWSGLSQPEAVDPITSFVIQYSKDNTFSSGVFEFTAGLNVSNRLFTGLDEGDEYFFRIAGVNDDGQGDFTDPVAVTIVVSPFQPQSRIDSPGIQQPVFFSFAGHTAGFDTEGAFVEGIRTERDYEVRLHTPITTGFTVLGDEMYAENVIGDTLYFVRNETEPGKTTTNFIRFKTLMNGENFTLSWVGNPSFPTLYAGKNFNIEIKYDTKEVILESDFSKNGTRETETCVTPIPDLDLEKEIAVTIQYELEEIEVEGGGVEFEYQLLVSLCPSDDFSNPIHCSLNYTTDARDAVTQRWTSSGRMRSLLTSNTRKVLSTDNVIDWELPKPYDIDPELTLFGPVPSVNQNVWEYIQDAASATFGEVAVVNDVIVGRKVGERILDVTNIVGSPTIEPTTVFAGRKIVVEHTNAELRPQGLMYYSRRDDNRILSINPGETITTTVDSLGSPTFIQQPIPILVSQFLQYVAAGEDFPFSCYGIIDQTALPVVPALWEDYNAKVEVKINNEIPGSIDITITGPRESIPGLEPPYSLAFAAGVNENPFGALAITGSGVVFNREQVEIFTGAPLDRTPTEVGSTITNQFVNTKEHAYNVGVWAADAVAGPRVTLRGSLPLGSVDGFGLTAGSLIRYRDNIYRVDSATFSNISVEFSASEHVLVEEFDEQWGDLDVAVHDELWGDNQVQDQKIFPFREVGYPDSQ